MIKDIKSLWIDSDVFTEDSAYGFVSGRIRVREKFFLDKERYEHLITCETETDFLSSLSDTPYAQFKEGSLLDILHAAEWENHQFLKEYAISPDLLKILLFPFDLHNLKLYQEGLKHSIDLSSHSSPFGYFTYPNFPPEIEELVKTQDSLDQLEVRFFSHTYSLTKRFPFLAQYLSLLSDIKNILALLRIIKFRLPSFSFLPHSHFGDKFFFNLSSISLSEIPERFPSPFKEILKETIPAVAAGDFGFLKLERQLMGLISSFLRSTRYLTYGYELLSTYYLQKRQEIENLRRIYLGRFLYKTDLTILKELVII